MLYLVSAKNPKLWDPLFGLSTRMWHASSDVTDLGVNAYIHTQAWLCLPGTTTVNLTARSIPYVSQWLIAVYAQLTCSKGIPPMRAQHSAVACSLDVFWKASLRLPLPFLRSES